MNIDESQSAAPTQSPAPASPNSKSSSMDETLLTMAAFIRIFLGCSDHQAAVLALWIAHTYCFDSLFLPPGRLPASLAARCIPIALRRLKPKEHVSPLWSSVADDAEQLSSFQLQIRSSPTNLW